VQVKIITPNRQDAGVQPRRVLINLHGGAFVGGAEFCGLVESGPISALGAYRVVSVDYRQGWEHRFPAASEDVALVYRALLQDYAPSEIGIFGYSAGGILTAQAMAWFQSHGLPRPGAVAICSAGAQVSLEAAGDASVLAVAAMGDIPAGEPAVQTRYGYFTGLDTSDPLISPINSPEVMAGFPPTLILTGGRAFDLSASLLTHRALLAAGVEAELHCWEGMWHCFPYVADMPEAQDAFRTLVEFFNRRLV
jgi:epsilon-lactone hydrolase